jgi:hypothetical protein
VQERGGRPSRTRQFAGSVASRSWFAARGLDGGLKSPWGQVYQEALIAGAVGGARDKEVVPRLEGGAVDAVPPHLRCAGLFLLWIWDLISLVFLWLDFWSCKIWDVFVFLYSYDFSYVKFEMYVISKCILCVCDLHSKFWLRCWLRWLEKIKEKKMVEKKRKENTKRKDGRT